MNMSFLGRLRTRLAIIIAASLLPAGAVAIVQTLSVVENQAQQRLELLDNEAQLRAGEERDLMVELRETLRFAARAVVFEQSPARQCSVAEQIMGDERPWLTRILVLDGSGQSICASTSTLSVAGLPEWDAEFLPAPRFTLGPARISRLSGRRVMVAYHPVADEIAGDAFALAAGIDVAAMGRLTNTGVDDELPFALIGNRGSVLVNRDDDQANWLPGEPERLAGVVSQIVRLRGRDDLVRDYIAHPLIPGQIWAVTGAPVQSFWATLAQSGALAVALPLILWVIAVGVAYVAVDQLVTRHVRYLQRVTARIGAGEFETEIRGLDRAPLELRRLAAAIRLMSKNLMERDARLRDLLSTQKSLLLEVHHRVKNNLQMISSLMNIQLRRASGDTDKQMLQLVQDRIHGLAMVHQNLYTTERLDHVALHQLVQDLCDNLATSLRPIGSRLNSEFDLQEVTVDAAVATPVALFVAEALGNVLKHEARPGCDTTIKVTLRNEGETFSLTLANPVKVPQSEDDGPSGLGTRLMEGFAQQLAGTMQVMRDDKVYSVTLKAPVADRSEGFELRRTGLREGTLEE
ncbi:MAG: sensor histidine kinase [Pseudomonadota bacterium]